MLDIQNITVQYGRNEPVLQDFSLKLKQGGIVSIVGESGSGKTTVIRSVLGNLPGGCGGVSGGPGAFRTGGNEGVLSSDL